MANDYPLRTEALRINVYTVESANNGELTRVTFGKQKVIEGYRLEKSMTVRIPIGFKRLWLDKWTKTTSHARIPDTDIYQHSVAEIVEHVPRILDMVFSSIREQFNFDMQGHQEADL